MQERRVRMKQTTDRLTTVRNFRDLGGARTDDGRRFIDGLVYRSGLLSELSATDRATMQDDLQIRTVIDIRRAHEHGTAGVAALDGVRIVRVPLTPKDVRVLVDPRPEVDSVVAWYRRQLEVSKPTIKQVIESFETYGTEPLVFHCHAGKDRTGVISAVLLGALGVVDDDIVSDYSRSRASEDDAWFATLPDIFREARPEVMQRLLDLVRDDFGSMREYLLEVGVPTESLARLEARYLVDDPNQS